MKKKIKRRKKLASGTMHKRFRHRSTFIYTCMLLCFCALFMRLYFLGIHKHKYYLQMAFENQVSLHKMKAPRGIIYDRNGKILAENHPNYVLILARKKLNNINEFIARLKKYSTFTEDEISTILVEVAEKRRESFIPVIDNLTEENVAHILANKAFLPEVSLEATVSRFYPYRDDAAHIVGYIARMSQTDLTVFEKSKYHHEDVVGKAGIERYYETDLHGVLGVKKIQTDAYGNKTHVVEKDAPLPGKDIHLTIDIRLQKKAQQLLKKYRGSAVMINPRNGEILAMASAPTFDPNLFVNGLNHKDYIKLANHIDKPLFNRAIQGLYPPASTIKPLVALGALEAHTVTPYSKIRDKGFYQINGRGPVFRDWKRTGHGIVDLSKAIAVSCDTYFYTLAYVMGIKQLSGILKTFGYGEITGVDLPNEFAGTVPSPSWKRERIGKPWYPGETVITGIGQGFMQVTPLQLAQAAMILANQGTRFKPHLVKKLHNPITKETTTVEPVFEEKIHTTNYDNWYLVSNAMKNVVHSGWGTARYLAHGLNFEIAGKTGTAQVVRLSRRPGASRTHRNPRFRDHTLFIAYAPAYDPKIAVSVVLENTKGSPQVAKALLSYYINSIH